MYNVKIKVLTKIDIDILVIDIMLSLTEIPRPQTFELNEGDIIEVVYYNNYNKIIKVNNNSYVDRRTINGDECLYLDNGTHSLVMTAGMMNTCLNNKLLELI